MQSRSGDKSPINLNPASSDAGVLALCDAGSDLANIATCAIELNGEPPEWVQLMPLGHIKANDGRRYLLDHAKKVVAASVQRFMPLVIDYEHQTDLAEENGKPAPASGWMNEMEVRADGIWARVEWTERAADMIRAREYRFLSPTFTHAKTAPHSVQLILRAALTNHPALELKALASTQDGDTQMDEFLKALAKTLGLAEDATEDQLMAAIAKSLASSTALAAIVTQARTDLGLAEDADGKAIASAIGDLKTSVATASSGGEPDPAQYVPIAQLNALTQQVAKLTSDNAATAASTAVEKAMTDGKVPPAMKDWAMNYAKQDLDGFTAYCAAQPAIFKPGSDVPNTVPAVAAGELSEADRAIASALGVDHAAFLATRKKEQGVAA